MIFVVVFCLANDMASMGVDIGVVIGYVYYLTKQT